MEQKKIEHITLHLMVFSTIVVIGILARQTALRYGWDEFSSYLILVVCSIVMGAIYFNLQMVFSQILSPVIEKCFMRFECYRNKVIVVEDFRAPVVDVEPVVSEPMVEAETTSDTSEEVSTPMFLKPTKERQTFQRKTPHLLLKNLSSHQNTRHFVPMRLLRKNVRPKKSWIRFSHTQNEP